MNQHQRNIALLCNPIIEKAIRITDEITFLLREYAIPFSIFTAYWPTVWDGFTEAWIIGGDGTINFFINQNPDFQLPIGVFAAGSGNDLHWMLYGETTLRKQVETFLKGHVVQIDAGDCNGNLFINGVGIGFDGVVVKSMLGKKNLAGKASYLLSIMKNIFLYREKYCNIDFNTTHIAQDCLMISIANGSRYGGGFQVAPKASLTDARLDLLLVGKIDARQRMRYLPVIERGAHLELPFVNYHQTDQVTIKAQTSLHAHMDGEYFSADVFEIRCLEKRFSFLR
jgi:YegS/Rv2252/BmrU family lipid kinase